MSANSILINIGAKTAQAVSEIGKVNKALGEQMTASEKAGVAIKKAAVPAAAALTALGGGALYAAGKASDLGESVNAVEKVFGPASSTIKAFGREAAKNAGLSERAFNQLATSTGSLLTNMGYSQKEAADASVELAQRAADMASVFNTDVDTALSAINAGLRGEAEPLRAFGVGLSDAAVKSKALEMGLYSGKGALDANAKAAATQALIMEQTAKVAGDFADTADGAANAQRVMGAQVENLSAQLGTALLPIIEQVLAAGLAFMDWASQNTGIIQVLAGVVAALAGAVLVANGAMKAYNAIALVVTTTQKLFNAEKRAAALLWARSTAAAVANRVALLASNAAMLVVKGATMAWTVAQRALNLALTMNPIGLVVAAIAALVAGLVLAYQKSETFRNIVDKVASVLKGAVLGAVNAVKGAFNGLVNALQSAWNWMKNLIGKAGELLGKLNPFKGIGNILGGIFGKSAPIIAPSYGAPATRAGGYPRTTRTAAPTIVVQGSINPHRTAQEIGWMLAGARVRTGFAGVRA